MFAASFSARFVFAAVIGLTLAITATWCTTGSRARRIVGVLLGVAVMLPPWLLPAHATLLRAVWGIFAFTTTMRVVDLMSTDWPFSVRVSHVLSVIDRRRLVRVRPHFAARAFLRSLAWATTLVTSIAALTIVTNRLETWAFGVLAVYAAVSAMYSFLETSYALLGLKTPPLHVSPIFSRSVQELWGKRWARPISEWLSETFFLPFARRRRPRLGLVLAFIVSAAFHAYAIWVGLGFFRGIAMASMMFAYFVLQAVVMFIERRIHITRWPAWAAHVWTIAWMFGLSPLFVIPMLCVMRLQH